MELSARDKRILADIACASALEDPKWTRRFERLSRRPGSRSRPRPTWRRHVLAALALTLWCALAVIGATVMLPLLWAALAFAALASSAWTARRRRIYGYWFPRRRRRIARIPRQGERGA